MPETAVTICAGFFIGSLLGAALATGLSNALKEKIFGRALLMIALKMIFLT